jgi:hypothetical protein
MTKAVVTAVLICLSALPAVSQSMTKYQVGTIIAVEPYRDSGDVSSEVKSYNVSLQVNDIVYVVRYKDPLGVNTVEHVAGRDILVFVGEKTITYNDMLGRSFEVPIVSRKPSTPSKSRVK